MRSLAEGTAPHNRWYRAWTYESYADYDDKVDRDTPIGELMAKPEIDDTFYPGRPKLPPPMRSELAIDNDLHLQMLITLRDEKFQERKMANVWVPYGDPAFGNGEWVQVLQRLTQRQLFGMPDQVILFVEYSDGRREWIDKWHDVAP